MKRSLLRAFSTARNSYPHYGSDSYSTHFRASLSISEYRNQWNNVLGNGDRRPDHDEEISLAGRVVSKREASKKLYFIDIESSGSRIQIMSDERHFQPTSLTTIGGVPPLTSALPDGTFDDFRKCHKVLQRGDVVGVTGFPAKSNKGELSIVPRSMRWLAPCLRELPAPGDPPPQDPNVRFRQRSMDLLSNSKTKQILLTRFKVISLMRRYLESHNFVEAETPILNNNAGGAAARPFVTSSIAFGSKAAPLHLRIAPELYLKQLVIGGFDRVFEIGKVFRNEGIDSTHNPEFTTCEFYQAYAEYEDVMVMTEDMLSSIELGVQEIVESFIDDGGERNDDAGRVEDAMEDDSNNTTISSSLIFATGKPFHRIRVYDELERLLDTTLPPPDQLEDEEAVRALVKICKENNIPCPKGMALSAPKVLDHMIGTLLEPLCVAPTFLCDHPAVMSPLAKNHRSRPGLTERFELFVNGKELCNAYTELNDPRVQRERFEMQMKMRTNHGDLDSHTIDEKFCEALEYGLPPTAGWGIGIDRLVMLLTRQQHIREVLPFVLMKNDE